MTIDPRHCSGSLSYCKTCIPLILESLQNSNIMIRCNAVNHQCVINHHSSASLIFKTQTCCWIWYDKVKISNDDRRRLIKELKESTFRSQDNVLYRFQNV